jgi:hypothetical protein
MTLVITINLDNAAFEDPCELAGIFRQLANLSEDRVLAPRALRDSNGNTVGSVKVQD